MYLFTNIPCRRAALLSKAADQNLIVSSARPFIRPSIRPSFPPELHTNKKAANLAPVCVSRRLLSADAYHSLALARQAGDHVEAGLTFVAEDDDEEEGESKGARKNAAGEGIHDAASAASQMAGSQGAAAAGADMGGSDGGDKNGATEGESNADGGGGGVNDPRDGAEEEDDLYGDLYGGLDDDDGGADMDVVPNASAGGDGGDLDVDIKGAGGGLGGGGVIDAGAGGGGDGMVEDVSTRAVMNALKVRENLPTYCWCTLCVDFPRENKLQQYCTYDSSVICDVCLVRRYHCCAVVGHPHRLAESVPFMGPRTDTHREVFLRMS